MESLNNVDVVLGITMAVITLFSFFQSRMIASERRLTILEEENKQKARTLDEYSERLKKHDKQNDVLIQLTQQLTNLTEKVDKMDAKLEGIR